MLTVSTLNGFGSGGGGPLVATFQSSATASVVSPVATYTNAPIGTASIDRCVIAGFTCDNNGSTGLTFTCDIGGVTATQLVIFETATKQNYSGLWIARVPTGTTATINVTGSGSVSTATRIHVWTMTGLDSLSPTSTGSTEAKSTAPGVINVNLTTLNNATFAVAGNIAAATFTWTNITERSDVTVSLSGHSAASGSAQPVQTLAVTCTPSATTTGAMVAASFSQ
jgi:hypothetical protein